MNKYLVKVAEKKPSVGERALTIGLTSYGARKISEPINDHATHKSRRSAMLNEHIVRQGTIKHMKRETGAKIVDVSKGQHHKKMLDQPSRMSPSFSKKPNKVYTTGNKLTTVHELGHAAAYKNKYLRGPRLATRAVGQLGMRHAVSPIGAGLLMTGDKEKAKYAPLVAAGQAAIVMADEGQANLHAYNAIKKIQGKHSAKVFAKKFIGKQLGAYASGVLATPVATYAAYKWLYGKKKDATEKR